MWWVIIIFIIILLSILLIVAILISVKDNSRKYDWINLPFYQKLKHLGRNPPDYAHRLADKYAAKTIAKHKCPKIKIAKLVYVTETPTLPKLDTILKSDKLYMMKANNASGRNKKISVNSDIGKINQKIERWLSESFSQKDEKFYGQMHPKIIIEEMIQNIGYEYRIYCFHGVPHYIRIKKFGGMSIGYYTPKWKETDIGHIFTPKYKNAPKPDYLNELVLCARQLSEGIAFVCVDIMATKEGKLYFCEFTFTPHNSSRILIPDKYQETFSNLWKYRDC